MQSRLSLHEGLYHFCVIVNQFLLNQVLYQKVLLSQLIYWHHVRILILNMTVCLITIQMTLSDSDF